jgi:hypothetical protein
VLQATPPLPPSLAVGNDQGQAGFHLLGWPSCPMIVSVKLAAAIGLAVPHRAGRARRQATAMRIAPGHGAAATGRPMPWELRARKCRTGAQEVLSCSPDSVRQAWLKKDLVGLIFVTVKYPWQISSPESRVPSPGATKRCFMFRGVAVRSMSVSKFRLVSIAGS